ncbi:ATP-dependent Clp protease ATP-binding subunit ClpB [Nematocida sp. AWRm77]|nr:ATP-dependent Clp protease ATP-binding subunit ClpB [Nematocida sp. AWRm77]
MKAGHGTNSEEVNKILLEAERLAREKKAYTIEPMHILLALVHSKNKRTLKAFGAQRKDIAEKAEAWCSFQPAYTTPAEPSVNVQEVQSVLAAAASLSKAEQVSPGEVHLLYGVLKNPAVKSALSGISTSELVSKLENPEEREKGTIEDFAVDMVQQAREGVFDPVIGRDKEIRTVLEVLTKKIKSNAMLLGEPGVGKTAIVNGLAQLIAENKAPGLSECRLYSVDLGAIVAGTMYHGQFEERLKALIKETEESNRSIILFIDEIHMVLGAGKTQGAMNAANLLKPGLASGSIRCIGATTYGEYKEYVEKDPAFGRRFVSVGVSEPSVEDTVTILRGLRERFEVYHGLSILNETLEVAAEMGSRYLTGGRMPDTAITLLDAACASVKVSLESEPAEIMALKSRIWAAELEKTAIQTDAARAADVNVEERLQKTESKLEYLRSMLVPMEEEYNQRMEHIVRRQKLKKKLEYLKNKLANAERERNTALAYDIKEFAIPEVEGAIDTLGKNNESICIRPEHIAETVSNITHIPVKRLTLSENQRLLHMEERLARKVVGQSAPIQVLTDAIVRSKAGFGRPNRPIGSFLFLGPTGVGKTQLAKSLAFEMFDDEQALVRLDMSEYLEEHSVSRLIGAPPGYVGYEAGGYLTEKIRNRPYSIILVDEIEKAHKKISNLFLQVLDEGRLSDGHGRTIDFTNTVIIMTSNLGASEILSGGGCRERALEGVKRFFPPEFINRLDGIEVFNSLGEDSLRQIVDLYVAEVNKTISKNKLEIVLDESAKEHVIAHSYTPEYGARPMQRYMDRVVLTDVSKIYLGMGVQNAGTKTKLHVCSLDSPRPHDTPCYVGKEFLYYHAPGPLAEAPTPKSEE